MRVGINLLPYAPNRQGGAEVYIRNLVHALGQVGHSHEFVLFVSPRGRGGYLPAEGTFSEVVLPAWSGQSRIARILAEQTVLPFYVKRSAVDCLVSTYVVPVLAPCYQIVCVHDMLYKQMPHLVTPVKRAYWSVMIPLSLRKSAHVVTLSRSSAVDIVRFFPAVQSKLSVVGAGVKRSLVAHRESDPGRVQAELGIEGDFILSAATFGPHKNMRTLIHAFSQVLENLPDLKLVLTGGANTRDAARERAMLEDLTRSLRAQQSVMFPGFVSDRLLAALYREARLYVIPSLYEGFGLSVLEAQFFGAPVLCSSAPALAEIAGDGALVVDATSVAELAGGMTGLLRSPERCSDLVERGTRNLSRYGWRRAAQEVLSLAEELASSSSRQIR
jgi:glycosyltransferase involved in cell wall biosynthesis